MHLLNKVFDKIFVISIARNAARLDEFCKSFKNVEIEVIKGIDGKELFPDIEYIYHFPKSFFSQNGLEYERCSGFNKGQLGCAMSNLFVQKEIIRRNLRNALILEDDAFLLPDRLLFFEKSLNELPNTWELLYLGYADSKYTRNLVTRSMLRVKYQVKPVSIQNKYSNIKDKMFLPASFSKHLYVPGIHYGTHAYALSNNGASKIIKLDTPLRFGFDTTLLHACYHKLIEAYALKRKLIIPNTNFETTLIN